MSTVSVETDKNNDNCAAIEYVSNGPAFKLCANKDESSSSLQMTYPSIF